MTDQEKLEMISAMSDETDAAVLSAYYLLAKQIILEKAFPFGNYPDVLPAQYDGVHVEAAVYLLAKRGAEGETVHLENGVSRHWEDGSVPPSILRRIVPFAGVMIPTESEEEPEDQPEEPGEEEPDEIDETEP